MSLHGICDTTGLAQFELYDNAINRLRSEFEGLPMPAFVWVNPKAESPDMDEIRKGCVCTARHMVNVESLSKGWRLACQRNAVRLGFPNGTFWVCACVGRLIE